nr:regulator [Streptomyces sp. CC228A]
MAARPAAARHHARADRRGVHTAPRAAAVGAGPRPRRVRPRLRGPGVRRHARGGRRHRQRPVAQGLRQPHRAPEDRLHPGGARRAQPGLADRPRRRAGRPGRARPLHPRGRPAGARTGAGSRRTGARGHRAARPGRHRRTRRGPAPRGHDRAGGPARRPHGPAGPRRTRRPHRPVRPVRGSRRGAGRRHRAGRRPGGPGRGATALAVPRQRGTERGPGQRVTGGDIAALRSVSELFRTLDHAYGGGHARQALVRYLEHEAEPMLRGCYGEAVGRRLFGATADLTRLAGWTSYDIAAHGLAQRYFVQALRLSQAAGDRAYGSYVLLTMSRQAVYLGHGREAVQLARVAQQGIGSSAPPVVLALLHAVEARGHAVLGEVRACTSSLVRAERSLDASRPGDEVPYWARPFDEAQLADEFAHCHRDLQQYRAAAQHAERALRLYGPGYTRSRTFCRVVLAASRLGLGELDQACALGAEAAQQASEMRSARATEYVRDFERRLEPYREAAAVRTYRDRVAALA